MGNINISTVRTKAYANEQRTMNNERYSKQTQSNPIFLRPKPTQPPVHPVIPTEGTLPVCRSGGICFNTLCLPNRLFGPICQEITPCIMQNKANFPNDKPSASFFVAKVYETKPPLGDSKKQSQSNPIPQPRRDEIRHTIYEIRDTQYEIRLPRGGDTNPIPLDFFPPRQKDSWGILGERGGMLLQACAVPIRPIF
jgi:hypothetical protein